MKQLFHNIYLAIAVHIPRTKAWKARKRQQACEESQGSIIFTRKFFIDDDLPLPAELGFFLCFSLTYSYLCSL